jgi:choice-of-anchor B domain-containing protein
MKQRPSHSLYRLSLVLTLCAAAGALVAVQTPLPAPVAASRPTPTPLPFPPQEADGLNHHDRAKLADQQAPQDLSALFDKPCVDGFAAQFPCKNVDLLAFLPLAEIGGGSASSSWGWTDPDTGGEYALLGRSNGTSFVDITDPKNPVYLGNLPTHTGSSAWRELKAHGYYAFIVSDANANHGMQIFDLRALRSVTNPPKTFSETAHYAGFGNAHTITLNPDAGFLFVNGTNTCAGGPHMVNIADPVHPAFAGCFSADGYTHDSQCVTYHGPDAAFSGHQICMNANEDTLNVLDVTNKNNPVQLARKSYLDFGYVHQGWLTPDHAYFILDDEFDETDHAHTAYSYIWDVRNLKKPQLIGTYRAPFRAIDHNQYIRADRIYQANYRAGLHVLDATNIASAKLRSVGYFDVYPADDKPNFNGAWNVYPFHSDGVVTIAGIEQGLFVVQLLPEPNPPPCPDKPGEVTSESPANGTQFTQRKITLTWTAHNCASTYKVIVRENHAKGKVAQRVTGLDAPTYTTEKLARHKTYWWRAFACNAWGCGKSEPRTFRIE